MDEKEVKQVEETEEKVEMPKTEKKKPTKKWQEEVEKAQAEADGREWIEPEEILRRQEEEAERLAEMARQAELKARCERKGLDFAEEEHKYQEKQAKRKNKKSR